MSARVLIPWRDGNGADRNRILSYVEARHVLPVERAIAPPGRWIKAAALMPAIDRLERNTIVVCADADVICDGLDEAIEAVRDGWKWAIPHGWVHRLSDAGTRAVVERGEPWGVQRREPGERPYRGRPGGGIVVARRETLLDVPLDSRFEGWGQEDEAWGIALWTLAGLPWRGEAPLVHLWHEPQIRQSRRYGSPESRALLERYAKARRKPEMMRALIDEAKDARRRHDKPSLFDHSPLAVG